MVATVDEAAGPVRVAADVVATVDLAAAVRARLDRVTRPVVAPARGVDSSTTSASASVKATATATATATAAAAAGVASPASVSASASAAAAVATAANVAARSALGFSGTAGLPGASNSVPTSNLQQDVFLC